MRIDVQLADDVQMAAVRAYMVLSRSARRARSLQSAPTQDEVDSFDGREIHVWLATDEPSRR